MIAQEVGEYLGKFDASAADAKQAAETHAEESNQGLGVRPKT
jgi:hypothetical protein